MDTNVIEVLSASFRSQLREFEEIFAQHTVPSEIAIRKLIAYTGQVKAQRLEQLGACICLKLLPNMQLLNRLGNGEMRSRAQEYWEAWGTLVESKIKQFKSISNMDKMEEAIVKISDEAEILDQLLEKIFETRTSFDKRETSAHIRMIAALQMKDTPKGDAAMLKAKECSVHDEVFHVTFGLHQLTCAILVGCTRREPFDISHLGGLIMKDILPSMLSVRLHGHSQAYALALDVWTLWTTEVEDFTWTKLLQVQGNGDLSSSAFSEWPFKSPTKETGDTLHHLENTTNKFSSILKKALQSGICLRGLNVLTNDCRYSILLWRYRHIFETKAAADQADIMKFLEVANAWGCFEVEDLIFYKILPIMKRLRSVQDLKLRTWADYVWDFWITKSKEIVAKYFSNEGIKSSEKPFMVKITRELTNLSSDLIDQCLSESRISFEILKRNQIGALKRFLDGTNVEGHMKWTLPEFAGESFRPMGSFQSAIQLTMQHRKADQIEAEFENQLQAYEAIFSDPGMPSTSRKVVLLFLCIASRVNDSNFQELVLSQLLPAAQLLKGHNSTAARNLIMSSFNAWGRTGTLLVLKMLNWEQHHGLATMGKEAHSVVGILKCFENRTESMHKVFQKALDPALTSEQRTEYCYETSMTFDQFQNIPLPVDYSERFQELQVSVNLDILTGFPVTLEKSEVGYGNESTSTCLLDAILQIVDLKEEKFRIMDLFQETSKAHERLKRRHQDLLNENRSETQKKHDAKYLLEEALADAKMHKGEAAEARNKMELMLKEHKTRHEAQKTRIAYIQSNLATAIDKEKSQRVLLYKASSENAELRSELKDVNTEKKINALDLARYKGEADERNIYKEALGQMTIERDREVHEHQETCIKLTDVEAELQGTQAALEELELRTKDKVSQHQVHQALLDQKEIDLRNALAEVRHLRKENAEVIRIRAENAELRKQLDAQAYTLSALSKQQQKPHIPAIEGLDSFKDSPSIDALSEQPEPEHPDTSKLFTSKSPQKGPMAVSIDLEDDIQRSVQNGMRNVAWRQGPPAHLKKAPTEHFPPLSTPAAAPIAENLPYRIIEIKDKKKGKCRKK